MEFEGYTLEGARELIRQNRLRRKAEMKKPVDYSAQTGFSRKLSPLSNGEKPATNALSIRLKKTPSK